MVSVIGALSTGGLVTLLLGRDLQMPREHVGRAMVVRPRQQLGVGEVLCGGEGGEPKGEGSAFHVGYVGGGRGYLGVFCIEALLVYR